jgi:hypothetical protein
MQPICHHTCQTLFDGILFKGAGGTSAQNASTTNSRTTTQRCRQVLCELEQLRGQHNSGKKRVCIESASKYYVPSFHSCQMSTAQRCPQGQCELEQLHGHYYSGQKRVCFQNESDYSEPRDHHCQTPTYLVSALQQRNLLIQVNLEHNRSLEFRPLFSESKVFSEVTLGQITINGQLNCGACNTASLHCLLKESVLSVHILDNAKKLHCVLVSDNRDYGVDPNGIDYTLQTYDPVAANTRHQPLPFHPEFEDYQLHVSMYCDDGDNMKNCRMSLEFVQLEDNENWGVETHRCETDELLTQLSLLEWTGVKCKQKPETHV